MEVLRQMKLAMIDQSVANTLQLHATTLKNDAVDRYARAKAMVEEIDRSLAKAVPEVEEDTVAW